MAITVTFSGSPEELLELFSSNRFLDIIRGQTNSKDEKPEDSTEPSHEPTSPIVDEPNPAIRISRQQMLHAVQEYAVRIHNRYVPSNPGLNVRELCASLINEISEGNATHTSKVPEEFIEAVYEKANADYIPADFSYLTKKKD